MSIRSQFDAGGPHAPTSAKEWGEAVSDAVDVSVRTTGDETIAGVKTFTSSPVVPTPTTDMQAATKAYADSVGGAGGDLLQFGDEYQPLPGVYGTRTGTAEAGGTGSGNIVGVPFMWRSGDMRVDELAVHVTTAQAATCRMGIYALGLDGVAIGAPLFETATIDVSTTGVKSVTAVNLTLEPGLYIVVLTSSAGTVAYAFQRVALCTPVQADAFGRGHSNFTLFTTYGELPTSPAFVPAATAPGTAVANYVFAKWTVL